MQALQPSPFDDVVEAVNAAMGKWNPENGADVPAMLESTAEVADAIRMALHGIGERIADGPPTLAGAADALRFIAGAAASMKGLAEEAATTFRTENKFWLEGGE